MIVSRETLLSDLNKIFGEEATEEQLTVIENITDTFTDFEEQISTSGDWKIKYQQNDAEWRKRYKERFMNPTTTSGSIIESQMEDVIDDGSPKSFAELFKEREG